jgi:chromosomal replication initiator protein
MPEPAVSDIQQVVAAHYEISLLDLLSRRRGKAVTRPRQVAMYLARHLTLLSLPEIGRRFDRDHTTVGYAVYTVDCLMRHDDAMAKMVDELRHELLEPGQGKLPLE